ncbi:MAG: TonB-dependent receptor [Sandaracinus sp.]
MRRAAVGLAGWVLVGSTLLEPSAIEAQARDARASDARASDAQAGEPEVFDDLGPMSEEGEDEDAEEPSFGARAEVPRIGVDAIDPSAAGTTILLQDRPRALETMDEILRESPGARARRTSGFGGFSTLSLRGADAEHTAVLLGELPLLAADGSAVDLSTLPPWMFDRVEIYRGGAPLWLSTGAIGGVVRLVPREGRTERAELALGAGSFDRYQGRASVSAGDERVGVSAGAGLVSSAGTFPYRDDNGTAFDPRDDRERARQNAQLLEGSGLVHLAARALDGTLSIVGTGLERTGGLAPPPSRFVDVPTGRRSSRRFSLGASMDWLEGARAPERASEARWRVSAALGAALEQRGASDPLAQFGQVPREASDTLGRVHARLAGALAITDWLAITAVGQYTHEEVASFDRLLAIAAPERAHADSRRDTAALGLEPRVSFVVGGVRVEGRISGRIEGSFASLVDASGERATEPQHVELALPTGRASLLVEIDRALSIVGSAAIATRAPSSLELFGDRGYLAGNVLLRPETSLGGDLGVVLAGRVEGVRGRVELRGFASHLDDLIRYQRVAQNQAVPLNVASARILGLEAGVSGDALDHLRLEGALTLLDARDETSGLALPLRPSVVGYARLEGYVRTRGVFSGVRVYAEVEHVSSSTADPAALVVIAERTPLGAGVSASFFDERVRLDLVVRDVFDVRGYDVLGLPLPGRSFAAELTIGGW